MPFAQRHTARRQPRNTTLARRLLQTGFLLLIVMGAGLMLYPFFPLLRYSVTSFIERTPGEATNSATTQRLLELPAIPDEPAASAAVVPETASADRRLLIPKIGVDIPIVEGRDEEALLRGAWRIPQTSDDPTKSNMALSAHRFRFLPPSSTTFYLLDKLGVGDEFTLLWRGRTLTYTVTQTRIVEPNAIDVLNPTSEPTVTLITCTPLFSTAQRLIVIGKLQS